ncbi:carotenoid oxygenase family protein [Pseudomonas sp. LS1212]|uniref:carotenoid oxygenase family protein n=1 Tax=Pseudomonas sp. LS1212 TaxID=2972478 RepID=UPI00215B77DD|nr:carotenoid oxygenase family protein [Pseudomonas sp. LS1212]UVJ45727.1 carotenoid oxygenase family protein [Pseudomonas sp. LS1212]
MRLDLHTGEIKSFAPGPYCTVQEHVHIASRQSGHEGNLAFVVDLRLRCQVHGNWVSAQALAR